MTPSALKSPAGSLGMFKVEEVTGNSQEEAHVAETVNESAIPQQETTSGNTTKPLTGWGSIKDGVWF
jgi:hypothetical protein